MGRYWLGLFSLATRMRGEGKCRVATCEESIVVGEQYVRINIAYGPGGKKISKAIHLRCVSPWLEYMAERRSHAPVDVGGRPRIIIKEEYQEQRKSHYRRLKYIIKKMETVNSLEAAEKLYDDYSQVMAAIEETGPAYRERPTPKRSFTLATFKTVLATLRKQARPVAMSSDGKVLEAPPISKERLAELDLMQKEILEHVAKGYSPMTKEQIEENT